MPKIIKTKSKRMLPDKPLLIYLVNALVGVVLTVICFFITSYLLVKGNDFSQFTKICLFIVIGISSALSGFLSQKRIKGRGYINGFLTASMYELMLLLLIACVMKFQISVQLLYTIPISLLSGTTGGIISANVK